MSESVTTFNGTRCTKVRRTHHSNLSSLRVTKSSLPSQTAFKHHGASAAAPSFHTSSPGNPLPSISFSSNQVNLSSASMSSSHFNFTRISSSSSLSMEASTLASRTSMATGADMSAHNYQDPSNDEIVPLKRGAIIGGTVGVVVIFLIALVPFHILRRRRRRRRHMKLPVLLNLEKRSPLDEHTYRSSRHLERESGYSTRSMSVYSETGDLNRGEPLSPKLRRPHTRSLSNFLGHENESTDPILMQLEWMASQDVRRMGGEDTRGHSRQPQKNKKDKWNLFPPSTTREVVTRNPFNGRPMDVPNPFLDPPPVWEPGNTLQRPATPLYGFAQDSSRNSRGSTSFPPMPDVNRRIENSIPNPSRFVPLNFEFGMQAAQGAHGLVPLPLRSVAEPVPNPSTIRRNDSMSSQAHTNSTSSGSVIILPGRTSTSLSAVLVMTASDISWWRRNRSANELGFPSRRSYLFDFERRHSGLTDDNSTFGDTETSSFSEGVAEAVAIAPSRS
ncbi:uncharacterized protein PADG_05263 [Paracoccidioides brasiliensis Pb18]|uniref:Uncharacterized protein n=1 Tax=Paracoccidioides brasiliensis (strain Pb18) TaxID=502780 RepID=C1GDC7_PARBD|nr:uncharacterized protein PADG_05263 [Paracoccidioides brasiliensis Pb18]EEH49184.1 hypothetical protein PADG_05263 [Paracoccidioides brasiliensis Pb18]